MDWAREMRGTSSRAKDVTPASASACTVAQLGRRRGQAHGDGAPFQGCRRRGFQRADMGQDIQSAPVSRSERRAAPACRVFVVRVPGGGARARLDQDLKAQPRQLLDCFRRGGHAPFALLAFPRYAQFHPPAPFTDVVGLQLSAHAGLSLERRCCAGVVRRAWMANSYLGRCRPQGLACLAGGT